MGVNDMSDKSLVVRSGGALGVSGVRDLKSVESANALLNLREKISQNTALVSDEWLDRLIKWFVRHSKPNKFLFHPFELMDKEKLKNIAELSFSDRDYEFDDLPDEFENLYNLKSLSFGIAFKHLPKVICKLTWLKKLDMSILADWDDWCGYCGNLKLSPLPNEFVNLQNLEVLELSAYKLYEFPNVICELKNLKILNLSCCDLSVLPNELTNLQGLEKLGIGSNNFGEFPKVGARLDTLNAFTAYNCGFTNLPNELENLQNLRLLSIGDNNFGQVPKIITKLTTITSLYIGNCGLTSLPNELANLYRLRFLGISNNNFSEFPQVIFEFKNLIRLEMANCGFSTLPKDFARLQNLEELDFGGEESYYKICCLNEFPRVILELPYLRKLWIKSSLIDDEMAQILEIRGIIINEPNKYKKAKK